jgi:transposase
LLEVSESTGVKWAQVWRATGEIAAKAMGGDKSSRIKGEDATWVLALVREQPDLTLEEIRARLAERGLRVSTSAVWRFLDAQDLRLKKNSARIRARST